MTSQNRGKGEVVVNAHPAAFGRLLRAMFGPAPLPERAPEEDRWIDEGGARIPGEDGWTHSFIGEGS